MKKIYRVLQFLYCIYAICWFVLLMLIVLPLVLLVSLLGKRRGGNLVYTICNWWGRIWFGLIGVQYKEILEAPHHTANKYIFVANHISYMDVPAIVRCMHQPIRVLGKYEMVKYPVFGWIYRSAVILVDRRDAEGRAKSVRALKSALKQHISIFIFPEGTFNETGKPLKQFYDGAFRIAIETNTPIKPLLFLDTIDRMHYGGFFTLTPGKCRVVFLEEIPVDHYTIKDLHKLKGLVHQKMESGLKKYRPDLWEEAISY